jgi:hypothetical protein
MTVSFPQKLCQLVISFHLVHSEVGTHLLAVFFYLGKISAAPLFAKNGR